MMIEKGKKYINNCGEIVEITRFDDGYKFPYRDKNGRQYNRRGEMPGYKSKYLVKVA